MGTVVAPRQPGLPGLAPHHLIPLPTMPNNRILTGWVAMACLIAMANRYQYPDVEPGSVKTDLLCANNRKHHITVLVEICTSGLVRSMRHLHGMHIVVHRLDVPKENDDFAARRCRKELLASTGNPAWCGIQ
eukprot:scaffold83816_cov18-Tisochrysis_lutea.AAC.1